MAMHYFHMVDGQTTFDSVGTDLPDLQSVRKEALRAGREMLNLGGERTVLGWGTVADMGHGRARWFRTNDPYHRTDRYGEDQPCWTSRRVDGRRFSVAGVPPNRASYMNCLM